MTIWEMIAPASAVRWPDSWFTEVWRGVGKGTPLGRELSYERSGFFGIRWKKEIWFCVYSVTEEVSCNSNPWETGIWLEDFLTSVSSDLKWGLLPGPPRWLRPFSLWGRVIWSAENKTQVPGLSPGEVGEEHSPGEGGRGSALKQFKSKQIEISLSVILLTEKILLH